MSEGFLLSYIIYVYFFQVTELNQKKVIQVNF